ncbi:MAG: Nif3-like dinuclear metal center hexameric protein, partial [Spirochaetaceae bacterium]|nr:Nif3-like dinuclear metal center hexameric protein [Spirochaetaceae bacterium]
LDIDGFAAADAALNGLQVDNGGAEVRKIAFAVDACLETFTRAAAGGARLLFVHHGLFWGNQERVTGVYHRRLAFLLEHQLALYAAHLPLDQHPLAGNNAALAQKLGLRNIEPFGIYHGRKIGYKGALSPELGIHEAARLISHNGQPPAALLPFGVPRNRSCAIISGGAAREALQAIDEEIDLYVTGEASHEIYHFALEGKLNMLCGGHYATEVWGVQKMRELCAAALPVETEFIDVPTGL